MTRDEYLLACLGEEAAEVAQRVGKALRFGLFDLDPANGETAQARLCGELNDLLAVVSLCVSFGILPSSWMDEAKVIAKIDKLWEFMRYSISRGTLTPPE